MISIVISVPRHTASVAALIAFARFHSAVTEVIVVDDGSNAYIAESADSFGATRIPCTFLGKGASMLDGSRAATNEIILFFDGDLMGLREDLIEAMTEPLTSGRADLVKSKQSRMKACAARPLVNSLFPEIAHLDQHLDGVIAARRSLLNSLPFDSDYGVDIGLLIDTALAGLPIVEVDVGNLEYDLQPLENLQDMITQFYRSLLTRAVRFGRLDPTKVQTLLDAPPQQSKEFPFLLEQARHPRRIALIDLDRVLLGSPLIVQLARRIMPAIRLPVESDGHSFGREENMSMIARLCCGCSRATLEKIAHSLTLRKGAKEVVSELRSAGYRVGLISDGFQTITDIVRRRIAADFSIAHVMKYREETATGQILPAPAMFHSSGCAMHSFCRKNILAHICDSMGTRPDQIFFVGGGRNDACLLRASGRSLAFLPETIDVRDAAEMTFSTALVDILPEIRKIKCTGGRYSFA